MQIFKNVHREACRTERGMWLLKGFSSWLGLGKWFMIPMSNAMIRALADRIIPLWVLVHLPGCQQQWPRRHWVECLIKTGFRKASQLPKDNTVNICAVVSKQLNCVKLLSYLNVVEMNTKHLAFTDLCKEEDTVAKECQNNEVDGGKHATTNSSLRFDPMIHDSIPVLSCQNLDIKKHTESSVYRTVSFWFP